MANSVIVSLVATGPCKLYIYHVVLQIFISTILQSNSGYTLFNFPLYI